MDGGRREEGLCAMEEECEKFDLVGRGECVGMHFNETKAVANSVCGKSPAGHYGNISGWQHKWLAT